MDKLQNKGKSKSLPQFKVQNTPSGQFWDFRGHFEVIYLCLKGTASNQGESSNT